MGWRIVRYGLLPLQRVGATHRRVKVDEDGAGDIFAAAGLSEEGFERATLANLIDRLGIQTTIRLEAVFEQVPGEDRRLVQKLSEVGGDGSLTKSGEVRTYNSQALLPSWAPAWPM